MNLRFFSVAVGMLAFSTIALELALTRIFSVTMYYHFAFMIISVALLGIAMAGVAVYLLPNVFRPERAVQQAAGLTLAFAVTSVGALMVALDTPIKLNAVTESTSDLIKVYCACALPFLMSGLAITLAIKTAGANIGRVYAFDLIGAALGCVAVVLLLSWFGAPAAIVIVAGIAAAGAALFALAEPKERAFRGTSKVLTILAGVVSLTLLVVGVTESSAHRFAPARNPGKFLGDRKILFESWNAFSQITVARGDDDHNWIFIDGDAATRMWNKSVHANGYATTRRIPEVRVASLAYALRHDGRALVIGPGGGADIVSSFYYGVKHVTGVEINPIIVNEVMKGEFAEYSGGLYRDSRASVLVDEGRSFIRRSEQKFATIQATLVDTWAASSSGAFALSENNLYTKEAFVEFLEHLEPNGILAMTRWYTAGRPMEFVRLLSLARASLEAIGVPAADAQKHVIVATDGDRRTIMLLGRAAFSEQDLRTMEETAVKDRLRILFSPSAPSDPANPAIMRAYREDPILASFIRAPNLKAHLATLEYDASPTTDDHPFFFYTLFPKQLPELISKYQTLALNNLGAVMLLVVLAVSVALTFVFVVGPLLLFRASVLRSEPLLKLRVLGYFLCLGLAFILVEIGLMQRFVLFLGHPIYSLAVVLATLLAASGTGSALSERAEAKIGKQRFLHVVVGALAVILVVYSLALTPLFHALLGLPVAVRIAIAATLVALPGVLMGTLLPSGVRAANAVSAELVPWAWGLNGASSVVGSILAVLVSMNQGFTAALLIGLAVYLLTPFLLPRAAQS